MRSCIYCGRELEKGEVCDCPQSVAHRAGKQQSSAERKNETKTEDKKSDKKQEKTQANYSNPYKTETSYKTGYAGTESKFERAKIKHKARKAARKAKANGLYAAVSAHDLVVVIFYRRGQITGEYLACVVIQRNGGAGVFGRYGKY